MLFLFLEAQGSLTFNLYANELVFVEKRTYLLANR